jgi:hypothetical protein
MEPLLITESSRHGNALTRSQKALLFKGADFWVRYNGPQSTSAGSGG